jgi:hypothetical protein
VWRQTAAMATGKGRWLPRTAATGRVKTMS